MADTDLPRDAAKILQQAADATRYSRKEYALTADQIRILAKSFNQMQSAATSASQDVADAAKNINDAFEKSTETLVSFTSTGLSTGKDLQSLFAAIASMVLDTPVKKLNSELTKEQKILNDLVKEQNKSLEQSKVEAKSSEDAIKILKDKIAEEEKLCGKKTKCNESMLASLKDQLKNEQNLLKNKNDEVKKYEEIAKIDSDDIKIQKDKIKSMQDQIAKLEKVKEIAKKVLEIFSYAFDRFVELDKAAEEFRKSTRLMRDQMVEIEKAALNINQELISQGVTIDKAYESARALTDAFSNSYTITQEQIKAVAQLNANLGVTEANATGFLQRMESAGGLTSKQAIGMAGIAAGAAKAAGVPLDKVMYDVANASDTTLAMMKGNVRQMTLAAIQAQRLGVSLEKAANSARGLLNFQESVDAEMESSVLLGRNLNLNYARQLSFAGDVAGAQKEILNQVRSVGDFTKMNVFQQEALAKATGYSVAELTSMLKNEEKLSKLKTEQRKAYEDATKALKEQNEETGEQLLQQAQMQAAMTQLSNTFKSFKQILADILTPVVNVAVKLLIPVLKLALFIFNAILIPVKILSKTLYAMWQPIEPLVQSVSDIFDYMNASVEKLVQYFTDFGVIALKANSAIMTISMMFGRYWNPLESVFTRTASVFGSIEQIAIRLLAPIRGVITAFGSAGGVVARFVSGFGAVGRIVGLLGTAGKAIPIIGWVITGLQAIWGLFSRLMKGMNFFEALGETLYDVFVSPFEILFGLLAKIPVIGVIFEPILKLFPIIKSAITSFYGMYTKVWNSLKELFSGRDIIKSLINIGKIMIGTFSQIPIMITNTIVSVFSKIFGKITSFFSSVVDSVKTMFSGSGGLISSITGFMTFIPRMILNAVSWYVTTIPKLLFVGIIKTISTVTSVIWNTITGVFLKIKEWFSNIDLFSGLFKGISSVGGGLLNGLFSSISSLTNNVGSTIKTNNAENKPEITTTSESNGNIINAIRETNRKLDLLITLMSSGGISVNLDGRKVSEQLAMAS